MTKLEELGGLEAARKWGDITTGISMRFIHALIEHIESLTAERDQLKKRVEELESKVRAYLTKGQSGIGWFIIALIIIW